MKNPDLKRIDKLYDFGVKSAHKVISTKYDYEIVNHENIENLENKSFVLLPNHKKRSLDILSEGYLLRETINRRAYFLANSKLPKIYCYFGAIFITRGKDIYQIPKRKRKAEIIKCRGIEEKAYRAVTDALNIGEIVVIHPEGGSRPNIDFMPKPDVLENLVKLETIQTPIFLPVDIDYVEKKSRSRITMVIGPFIQTREKSELNNHLLDYIHH